MKDTHVRQPTRPASSLTVFTLGEAARYKNCSPTYIDRQYHAGRLPALVTSGSVAMRLFTAHDLDRLVIGRYRRPRP